MSRYVLILFLLHQMCAAYADQVIPQDQLKITEVGDNVHLSCLRSRDHKTTITWMKQKLGEKPIAIVTSYQYQAGVFHNDFDKSGRFKTQTATGSFNLTISNLESSDTATYYCAVIFLYDIMFGEGIVLIVKSSSLAKYKVHQQPVLEAVHPGDSVTLQCSVFTESCSGEHSVYWFRPGSGESHPGIIYTHGNRSDECKKSSELFYKLPKRNLSLSDAGTYYCAVLMCGEIIFGNGTKLDFVEKGPGLDPTIVGLATSNIISLVVVLFLCGKLHNGHHNVESAAEGHTVQAACEALNFEAGSYNNKLQQIEETDLYSQIMYYQQN